jgi:hypothetical protein
VEATKKAKEAQQIFSSQNRKPSFIPRPKPVNPTTHSAPLKIQKLTRAEMVERQLKGLCYNCDEKYFPGHKCKEQNIFMAISEDIQEEDVDTPPVPESPEISDINPPSDPPEVEPIIMRSFKRRAKTMSWRMHCPRNMKTKDPFFLFPSLYPIGSKLCTRNGFKIPKVRI